MAKSILTEMKSQQEEESEPEPVPETQGTSEHHTSNNTAVPRFHSNSWSCLFQSTRDGSIQHKTLSIRHSDYDPPKRSVESLSPGQKIGISQQWHDRIKTQHEEERKKREEEKEKRTARRNLGKSSLGPKRNQTSAPQPRRARTYTSVESSPGARRDSKLSSPRRHSSESEASELLSLHSGDPDSMATNGSPSGRGVSSPRPKGRDAKHTLCRNVTIYGHCRYENSGCNFQHPPAKSNQSGNLAENKKRLLADSPAFQPPLQPTTNFQTPVNGASSNSRNATISPKAAGAAIFTPKSQNAQLAVSSNHTKELPQEFYPTQGQSYQELGSQTYDDQYQTDTSGGISSMGYDTFGTGSILNALPGTSSQMQLNSYSQDAVAHAAQAAFYQSQTHYQQPPNHHMYFPLPTYERGLNPYERRVHDFFLPEALRDDLQKKSDATQQYIPNTTLPAFVDSYHSLMALAVSSNETNNAYGYKSYMYKAQSRNDGGYYALRRLERFSVFDGHTTRKVIEAWKSVTNPGLVKIHSIFTTGDFGDRSLIVVTDFHPQPISLKKHFQLGTPFFRNISEDTLWRYLVQIASALKDIHAKDLAARTVNASKVLVTSQNRLRLNGCAVLDVIDRNGAHNEPQIPLEQLQQQDLQDLGLLMLQYGTGRLDAQVQMLARSPRLQDAIRWLSSGPNPESPQDFKIDNFLQLIMPEVMSTLSSSLYAEDVLTSHLSRELENGRLVRLMAKLGTINERGEYEGSLEWSEVGTRYSLKLFRDYVFHQVDSEGKPDLNLGHIITCLNKLDAGSEEKIRLTTRDDEYITYVSYKELKDNVEDAFRELQRRPTARTYGR